MRALLGVLFLLFIAACSSPEQEEKTIEKEVVRIHDEAMLMMDEIAGERKKMKNLIASLRKDTSYTNQQIIKTAFGKIKGLKYADDEMMDWMEEFKVLAKLKGQSHEEIMAYYQVEEEKIKLVDKVMKESIINAKNLIDSLQQLKNKEFPFLGFKDYKDGDTLNATIPDFLFFNQNGDSVTAKTFENKVYVVDFFFTNCPTICPKVKRQMLRVYEAFKDNNDVLMISHTLDPKRDKIEVLKRYTSNLGVSADKWHFVRGDRDLTYTMAKHYLISAEEDPRSPGGFAHSGNIMIIDKNKHIRGYYDGTDSNAVNDLIQELPALLIQ